MPTLLLTLAIFAASDGEGAAAAAAETSREIPDQIAVLDPVVTGKIDKGLAPQIAARIAEVLGRRPNVRVLTADAIRAMLKVEMSRQLAGCTDEVACLVEIAASLGASLVVGGRLARIADGLTLTISMVNSRTAEPEAQATVTWGGETSAILEVAESMIEHMEDPDAVGSLTVLNAQLGSQVLIDNELRATMPTPEIGGLTVGPHQVRVVLEGFEPFQEWVIIRPTKTTSVSVQLSEIAPPFYATWWFWTAAGVVVAGGTVATYFGVSEASTIPAQTGVPITFNYDKALAGGR